MMTRPNLKRGHAGVRVLTRDTLPDNYAKAEDVSLLGVAVVSEHFRRGPAPAPGHQHQSKEGEIANYQLRVGGSGWEP
jgi:hypothetical protein